jgi:phosphoribosylformylglycinamidine (FGAM) synthase-like enzyme
VSKISKEFEEIFKKWDIHAVHVGKVTSDGKMKVFNKGELVAKIADEQGMSQKQVDEIVTALLDEIKGQVAKGEINVCANVRLACQRFLDQIERKDWEWYFDYRTK